MVESPVPATKNIDPHLLRSMTRRIGDVYRNSTREERVEGKIWYPQAHDHAERIGKLAGGDVHTGAGLISVFSPQTGWDRNLALAEHFARHGEDDDLHHRYGGVYQENIDKAHKILAGQHIRDITTNAANKTRSFYNNIIDPDNPHFVTIDKHAHDIATGIKNGDDFDRGLRAMRRYDHFVHAYSLAANRQGLLPNEMQATTWVHWRHIHGSDRRARLRQDNLDSMNYVKPEFQQFR